MAAHVLNIAGLIFGIVGVAIIFRFGPPQPRLEPGSYLLLEGPSADDDDKKTERVRQLHSVMSKSGLALVIIGFALQLCAEVVQLAAGRS